MDAAPGQLRWRCRRGMKELDVLLERYLSQRYCSASDAERREFLDLLDAQDPVLYAYCMGQTEPPAHLRSVVARIVAEPGAAG